MLSCMGCLAVLTKGLACDDIGFQRTDLNGISYFVNGSNY